MRECAGHLSSAAGCWGAETAAMMVEIRARDRALLPAVPAPTLEPEPSVDTQRLTHCWHLTRAVKVFFRKALEDPGSAYYKETMRPQRLSCTALQRQASLLQLLGFARYCHSVSDTLGKASKVHPWWQRLDKLHDTHSRMLEPI